MAKKKHRKKRGLSGKEMRALALGYGGDPLTVLQTATAGQRARIRRRARREGVTTRAWIQGGPAHLREMSSSGIRRQAAATVRGAFAPGFKDVDQQEARMNSVAAKRRNDEVVFNNWLNSQNIQMETAGQAADRQIMDELAKLQGSVASGAQQTADQAKASVVGANTGSDVSKAGALDFSPQTDRAKQGIEIARVGAARQASASAQMRAQLRGVSAERSRSEQTLISGQLSKSLQELGDERSKLRTQRGAEAAKEEARLRDTEVKKGQAREELRIAADKLGVQAMGVRQKDRAARRKFKLDTAEHRRKVRKDQTDARLKEIDQDLKRRDMDEKERHNLVGERNALLKIKYGRKKGSRKITEGARKQWGVIADGKALAANWLKSQPGAQSRAQILKFLRKNHYSPTHAEAIFELVAGSGLLRGELRRRLRDQGVYVPRRFRG